MPEDRDRDEERDEDGDEADDEPESDEADARDEDTDADEEDAAAAEPPARPESRASREHDDDDEPDEDEDEADEAEAERRRIAARKKAAERKKTAERRKSAGERGPAEGRRSEQRRRPAGADRERPRRRDDREERRPPQGRGRKADATGKKREPEAIEIREPETPPEPEVDLTAPLDPRWEHGLIAAGALMLLSVALALGSLLYSGGRMSTVPLLGMVLLLVALASGGFGVLARKNWGYVLGLGASGLGVAAATLWTLYGVVTPRVSFWFPLGWLACGVAAVYALFHMRWGPGPLADGRSRLRALKARTRAYTTMHGEFAYAGAIAALLGSLLALSMLLGATGGERQQAPAAQYADGMQLERLSEPPEDGTLVLARWGNEVYFFLGRADGRREGDEIHVSYLDGDQEWLRLDDLRRDTVRAGAVVHVHIQGQESWLPAQVTQRTGDRIEVDLGSRRVWVPLSMVRVREL